MRVPQTSFLRHTPIAHRGLHGNPTEAPENSYAAFSRAIALGYAIETDLHMCADSTIVLMHDANPKRMTGTEGEIARMTWQELSALRLPNGESIPRFDEFLAFVDGKVPLLIELKDVRPRKPFVRAVLAALQNYAGEYALQSFDPAILLQVKKQAPQVLRGQLGCQFPRFSARWFAATRMCLHALTRPDFISYNIADLPCRRVQKKAKLLLGWTARTADEYLRVQRCLDNVIFENIRPEKLYDTCGKYR